jgi:hypothetical protein
VLTPSQAFEPGRESALTLMDCVTIPREKVQNFPLVMPPGKTKARLMGGHIPQMGNDVPSIVVRLGWSPGRDAVPWGTIRLGPTPGAYWLLDSSWLDLTEKPAGSELYLQLAREDGTLFSPNDFVMDMALIWIFR